ncbi:MAG: histidine phosphatase family protein [Candidatus Thorarchaeota archaeon]|jgi:broad specificity phosphatase PhoE
MTNNEWNSQKWLADASNLIDWSHSVNADLPLMILVRHSHRETIHTLMEMSETGITPLGEYLAKEFGRRLNAGRITEIHHSSVPRCEQTANEIANGIREMGGKVQYVKPSHLLVGPKVTNMSLWEKVGDDGIGVHTFVMSWERGELGDGIEPFIDFSGRLKRGIFKWFKTAGRNSLHICVTHDLFLMAAQKSFLREEAHQSQRPPYLGGCGLAMMEEKAIFYDARTKMTFELAD